MDNEIYSSLLCKKNESVLKYIKRIICELYRLNLLTPSLLEKLQEAEYCCANFGVTAPILCRKENTILYGNATYNDSSIIQILNENYFIYAKNDSRHPSFFYIARTERWVREILRQNAFEEISQIENCVTVGKTITVLFLESESMTTYLLINEEELMATDYASNDYACSVITDSSPLGKALLGQLIEDVITVYPEDIENEELYEKLRGEPCLIKILNIE